MVVASTASPFKFAADVYFSLTGNKPADPLATLDQLAELSKNEIPYPLKGLGNRQVRFTETIEKSEMREAVLHFLSQK